jgi:hypothetical protein
MFALIKKKKKDQSLKNRTCDFQVCSPTSEEVRHHHPGKQNAHVFAVLLWALHRAGQTDVPRT